MDTETSRQIVLDYLAAQGAGDAEKLRALLDEKVQWMPPASVGLGTPTGPDAVLQTMAEVGARVFDMSTLQSDVRWIVAEGDTVVVRMRSHGKAANGRDYANEYVWVYVVADGKIVRIEEHTDSLHFHRIEEG